MGRKIFLIDGHSHLYRAFFALKGLGTMGGKPTNAVYGFTVMLRKLRDQYAPDYLAVAFDMPGPTFRHKIFAEYKATREKPPDEFLVQIPMTRDILEALRIPVLTREGYEADDILGTAAREAAEQGLDVVLVTGDKDAEQLVTPHVSLLDTMKDRVTTPETLRERYSIGPEQIVDMMALSGDATDNVPGVPNVGHKTALKLIQEYGTLDNVLAHADDIKAPRLRQNLKDYAEQARLSRKLVTIDTQVPIELDLESCRTTNPDIDRLRALYEDFGFRQLLADIGTAPATQEAADYHLVDSEQAFAAFLAVLRTQTRFSLDLETTSTEPMRAGIVGMSFSWKEKEAWYLPLRAPLGEKTLNVQEVLAALRPILEDNAVAKVGQNIKYDTVVLRNNGIELQGIAFDTMVAAYVLNAERRRYGLDELAWSYLNYRMTPISDLIGKGKKQITMDQVPVQVVCDYACADADIAFRLCERLQKELDAADLRDLFEQIEMPLVPVLAEMEYRGIGLDTGVLKKMSAWLGERILALEKDIFQAAGEEFNIGSTKQLAHILFEKMGMPTGRRTKTGVSTDSDVLSDLAISHPLPGMVIEYRTLTKLKSTYVDNLPQMLVPSTGRLHTSFNQTATATGRLSSSDPNLQNIPIRTEIGERIRKAFVPSSPDLLLLTADYSQIELRILAHICRDEALCRAFAQDEDIHRFVASQVHGVPSGDVTPEMRRAAKAVNFGIIYGLTPYGLSRDLRIPVEQAKAFIDQYFSRYPAVQRFIDETLEQARKDGYVITLCGRKRALPDLNDSNRAARGFAERAAVNAVIQGTAADMIKIAMNRIHRRLRTENRHANMLLQIHDELVFELPAAEEKAAQSLVVDEMVAALKMDVPIKVNVAIGKNWLDAK